MRCIQYVDNISVKCNFDNTKKDLFEYEHTFAIRVAGNALQGKKISLFYGDLNIRLNRFIQLRNNTILPTLFFKCLSC